MIGSVAQETVRIHGIDIPPEADGDPNHAFWNELDIALDTAREAFASAFTARFPSAKVVFDE